MPKKHNDDTGTVLTSTAVDEIVQIESTRKHNKDTHDERSEFYNAESGGHHN